MSDPFVAEIRIVGFTFAPKGWAFCNGQLMPISQNTALFSLLGTTFGGDGKSNFALPNLQGCSPMQPGQGAGLSQRDLGETGGSDSVTLLASQIPSHSHGLHGVTTSATTGIPSPSVALAKTASAQVYRPASNTITPAAMAPAGGDQPHNNRQPYLAMNFVIALQGVYPTRS